ncbi:MULTISPECIES: hypothetical protein [Pasteurellaceae]|uniref:Uncharacterized protein n=1 Tax=Pasteurella atlantica TaxID=2827233 RepID=A0AAW8CN97_9PAST|nr:hypothetical protein [Pasteurella atlantica]MBR0573884.1 hypothetical protein [Pasteurella atlantica]MDP8039881.1 hypothetical protein [Pasteurella atlantica]MDP8041959.1 hypothetical protein [Pasteurella atlantica]MDP8044108.1 hypothetical protein [Pasteurella atlantica]MDP8046158.1 hypothetical protein [Pasteurella atlantica]
MIKKTRKEILVINPTFSEFIVNWQLKTRSEHYEVGESVWFDESDDVTILNQELADKLNQELDEYFEKNRDHHSFDKTQIKPFLGSAEYISSKTNTCEYLYDLANLLENIRKHFNEEYLMILGVQNIPWLYQDNDYEPVKKALNYLRNHIEEDFDGGFLLKENELYEFIPHLFWLIRCNASLPYFYFTFPNIDTVISICKFGVLHFEFYDESQAEQILNLLSSMEYKEVYDCNYPINF